MQLFCSSVSCSKTDVISHSASVQFWASERGVSGRAAPAARWAGFQPTVWRRSRPRPRRRGAVSIISRGCVAVGGGTLTSCRTVLHHPVSWRESGHKEQKLSLNAEASRGSGVARGFFFLHCMSCVPPPQPVHKAKCYIALLTQLCSDVLWVQANEHITPCSIPHKHHIHPCPCILPSCRTSVSLREGEGLTRGPSSFCLSYSLPCATIFFILWYFILWQSLIIDIITKHSVARVNSPHPPALLVFPALRSMSAMIEADGEQLVLPSRCLPSSGWLILNPDPRPLARGSSPHTGPHPNCPQVCLQRKPVRKWEHSMVARKRPIQRRHRPRPRAMHVSVCCN